MKKIKVPIFTDEYFVNIFIGTPKELIEAGTKYLKIDRSLVEEQVLKTRGTAWNALKGEKPTHPLILLDGTVPLEIGFASLAHESSHIMDYIIEFIGLEDKSGEFRGHGIGAIVRLVSIEVFKKYISKPNRYDKTRAKNTPKGK